MKRKIMRKIKNKRKEGGREGLCGDMRCRWGRGDSEKVLRKVDGYEAVLSAGF